MALFLYTFVHFCGLDIHIHIYRRPPSNCINRQFEPTHFYTDYIQHVTTIICLVWKSTFIASIYYKSESEQYSSNSSNSHLTISFLISTRFSFYCILAHSSRNDYVVALAIFCSPFIFIFIFFLCVCCSVRVWHMFFGRKCSSLK